MVQKHSELFTADLLTVTITEPAQPRGQGLVLAPPARVTSGPCLWGLVTSSQGQAWISATWSGCGGPPWACPLFKVLILTKHVAPDCGPGAEPARPARLSRPQPPGLRTTAFRHQSGNCEAPAVNTCPPSQASGRRGRVGAD